MSTPDNEIRAGVPPLLPVDEARRRILDLVQPVRGHERVAVRDALGRVLAEDIESGVNVPPHDNSAMDGYAVVGADLPESDKRELRVIGSSFAGAPFTGSVEAGQCVRIMTGAVIPDGTDTVVMQEHVVREGDRIRIDAGHKPGQNVRRVGEDMAIGQVVLHNGRRIMPAELGLLASLGIAEVTVTRRLRVAFFSTGDELRGVGETLEPGQIYDSNRYTLFGMLTRMGAELIDMGVIRDQREEVRDAFRQAAGIADAVITSGGVSVGEADYVKETLDELGQVDFWKIAMKPGKPLAVGRVDEAAFFGLPGNPVSAMVTFYQFVQPALRRMTGQEQSVDTVIRVPCLTAIKKRPGRTEFQRGVLQHENGSLAVSTTGLQGSHVLTSMSKANCFIILPAENNGVAAGETVAVQPFAGLV